MRAVVGLVVACLLVWAVDAARAVREVPYVYALGDTLFAQYAFTTEALYVGDCQSLVAVVGGNGTAVGGADSVTIALEHSIDGTNWEPFTTGYVVADSLTLRDFDAYRMIRVPLVQDAIPGAGTAYPDIAPNRYFRISVTNAADSAATAVTPDTLVNLSVGVFGYCR